MYYSIKIDYNHTQVGLTIKQLHSSATIAIAELIASQNQICIGEGIGPTDQYATDNVVAWSWTGLDSGVEPTIMLVAGSYIRGVINELDLKLKVDDITDHPIRFSRKIGRKPVEKIAKTEYETVEAVTNAVATPTPKVKSNTSPNPWEKLRRLFAKVTKTDYDWEISTYDLIVAHWKKDDMEHCTIFAYDEMLNDMLSVMPIETMCIYSEHHWLTSNHLRDEAGTQKSFKHMITENSSFWSNECTDFGDVHYRFTDGRFTYSEKDDIWIMDYNPTKK